MLCRSHAPARPPLRAAVRTLLRCVGGLGALWVMAAGAANWELAPRVQGGYRYNDNYRLDLPGGELEVSGAELDAQVTLRTVDPRTRIEITPRVRATRFPDEPGEDSSDYFLRAAFVDETPRRRTGVLGDFSREDVVRSEFPGPDAGGDLGDPDAVDSGRLLQRNRRTYVRVEPYLRYDLTQRLRLELDGHYLRADFDEQFGGAQQDFDEQAASAGVGFMISQRSSVVLRGVVSRYETTFNTDAYGGEIEWGTNYSENSRMYVRAGAQQTSPERRESHINLIAGVGGRWASPRNSLFLDLTRTVGPVSAGTVVERNQLRVRLEHGISPRLVLQLGARASRDEEIREVGNYPRRDYVTADAGILWRVQRSFSLAAIYNYRWQEYEDEPSDASANGFLLGVIYEPKRLDR